MTTKYRRARWDLIVLLAIGLLPADALWSTVFYGRAEMRSESDDQAGGLGDTAAWNAGGATWINPPSPLAETPSMAMSPTPPPGACPQAQEREEMQRRQVARCPDQGGARQHAPDGERRAAGPQRRPG